MAKRTNVAVHPTPELNQEALAERQQQLAVMGKVQADYGEDRDLANQLIGQAQMADAFSQFSRTVRLSKLAYVKENGLYKAIAGKTMPNGSASTGTWEDFCSLLGCSKDKVDLDLQNLKAFGAEALDAMSRMGIGYREMRQFRALPEDGKSALIEVAKTGDKEAVLEFAEQIIAKQFKEKEALQHELAEAQADIATKKERIAKHVAETERLETDLRKTKQRIKTAKPSEVAKDLVLEIEKALIGAETHLKTIFEGLQQLLQDDTHQEVEAALARVGMGLVAPTAEVLACLSNMGIRSPAQALCAGLEDAV